LANAGREDDRLAGVEVGQLRRVRLHGDGPVDMHVGEHGAFELADERAHLLAHLAHVADERERAAARFGGLLHEDVFGRRSDAHREEAPVAELRAMSARSSSRCRRRRRS
jgi:hypothetical protein